MRLTFATLPFYSRALQIYQNTLVRFLSSGHPSKTPYQIYFYNVHYLSNKHYSQIFFIFITSIERTKKLVR
jgi:hypothetical protein